MKNYRQLNSEIHEIGLILQKSYNRGYEQAKTDYYKPPILWSPISCESGLQFRCNGCKELSIAAYPYCPWCGCGVDVTDEKEG